MRLTMLCLWTLSCTGLALVGCNGATKTAADSISIYGQVRTEAGLGLAGVQVCFVGGKMCATSDANGNYKAPYDNKSPEPVVVQFSKAGFARRVARMHNATIAQAGMVLRAVDSATRVTLPKDGEAAVSVSVVHDDAKTTLSIGPSALVDALGALAAGDANVSLTFFHPLRPLQAAPAALEAEDGNAVKGLITWGMADIEIEQNGALLQVAPNQTLGWHVTEPAAIAQTLSPNAALVMPVPDLYSLNANTGLWHLEGSAKSGAVAYDQATTTVQTKLPHLSSWNIDSDAGPAWGGCVTGRIVDPCGKPVANKAITIWYLGFEQLKDWTGTVTGADGTFCTPTYLSSFNVTGNKLNINYFVAGAGSIADTSMCNPAPASCFNCVDEQAPWQPMGWCTNCLLDPSQSQPASQGTEPPTYYTNTCNAPSINLVPYSSCSSGGCTALGDIVLSSTTCNTPVAPNSGGGTPTSPDPCKDGTGKTLGEACTTTDVCCPRSLVCEDLLCLPPKDNTPVEP